MSSFVSRRAASDLILKSPWQQRSIVSNSIATKTRQGNSSGFVRGGFRYKSTTTEANKEAAETAMPTSQQLRLVAMRAAIPMVGFGIMDNFVMITAGDAIDSTFGVAFGLSTMAAAGFGQCVSDVAGVTSGGIVDNAVSKLNLPKHGLSQAQLDLKRTRMYTTFGACVGVLTGCLIGMSVLLFMDTDRAEREKRAKELQSIFESVMKEGHKLLGCRRATLFMLDEDKNELWSRVATGSGVGIIKTPADVGLVGACVSTGETVNVPCAYDDPRFNKHIDEKTGYTTKSVLCMPVRNDEGKIIGAIEMINKQAADGSNSAFDKNDERMVLMMASHVKSFLRIIDNDDQKRITFL